MLALGAARTVGDTEAPRLLEPLGFRLNAKKPDRWIDKLQK